jgi:hypothetical protein
MAGVTRAGPTGVELTAFVLRAIAATLSDALTGSLPALAGELAMSSVAEAEAGPERWLAVGVWRRVALDPVVTPSRTGPAPFVVCERAGARASEARAGVVVCAP